MNSTSSTTGGFNNSYGYDELGEQTSRTTGGTTYTQQFDYDGRLLQINIGSTREVNYVYDALGRRYSRETASTTTYRGYAGPFGLLIEYTAGLGAYQYYTQGNELLRKDGEYPLTDGLGNERMITDSTQATTGTIIQEGFGNTVATTGSSTNPFKWHATSGYRDDGDFGLMEVGARYYDPEVGRFITRDTDLDEHAYLYCDHDSINCVDPSGHNAVTEWLGRTLGLDFNFNRDDWHHIFQGEEGIGRDEMLAGGLGTGGGYFSKVDPRYSVPGFAPRKFLLRQPGFSSPVMSWKYATPGAVLKTAGAGLALGGAISVIIGKIGQHFTE